MMELVAGDYLKELVVEEESRSYLVHIPPGLDDSSSYPLILALHGRGIDAEGMVRLCGMNELADRDRFIVVYPNGRLDPLGGRGWLLDYDENAMVTGSAELPYMEKLLDRLTADYPIDRKRIYGVGFSNGGMICYAMARWMTSRLTAIGCVAGIVDFAHFDLEHPISIIHVHGTRDRFIPYQGGRTARKDLPIDFPPVNQMLDQWRQATGCTQLRRVEELIDTNDPTLVTRIEDFGPGRDHCMIKVVTVQNGGHTWPGRPPIVSYLGKWTSAFSASELILSFCEQAALSR